MNITPETKIISNIAGKQTKLGAHMNNHAYSSLKLNYIYIPFTVTNCKNAIIALRTLGFKGSAVSMPFKIEVMRYLDEVDPIAEKIGAVNTVLNKNGVLVGYNSDWIGATKALEEVTSLKGKTAIILGAGGVAKAIAYGLKKNNCRVIILNRTEQKARKLATQFRLTLGGSIKEFPKINDYDILINATSVGFGRNSQESIISKELIKENKIVMDVVFDRIYTPFLKTAKTKNCRVIPGYKMVVRQAAFQFELFTNKKAPLKVMEEAITELL